MLLFTWAGLMAKLQQCFEWSFRVMEGPNRNVNIVFIVIGAIGMIYWLWRQTQYNKEAEQNGTIK
jgi:hypothetical protein